METKKGKRPADFITAAVFIVFIAGFALALLIQKDRAFSEMENRTLAQKPEISWKNIKEGRFTDELEKYISDQLFAKDTLVSVKTDTDRLLGKRYQNGVYIIHDSDGELRFVQRYTENRAQIAENVGYLNDFAEGLDIPADLMLIPNVSAYTLNKLPAGALCDDQRKSLGYVGELAGDKLNYYPMLLNDADYKESYYFRTDHHWSFEGAQKTVSDYLKRSGQISDDEQPALGLTCKDAQEGFLGTLYSKAPSAFTKPDVFRYVSNCGEMEVEWVNEGKKSDCIIDEDFLTKKDKYAAYFGGNFSQIRIRTGHEGERVLVLKDSYANAAMQFLVGQYSEITMIDLRYYHMQEKTVSELCEEYGIDRVIMLYNMDFLNEDRNFVWLE